MSDLPESLHRARRAALGAARLPTGPAATIRNEQPRPPLRRPVPVPSNTPAYMRPPTRNLRTLRENPGDWRGHVGAFSDALEGVNQGLTQAENDLREPDGTTRLVGELAGIGALARGADRVRNAGDAFASGNWQRGVEMGAGGIAESALGLAPYAGVLGRGARAVEAAPMRNVTPRPVPPEAPSLPMDASARSVRRAMLDLPMPSYAGRPSLPVAMNPTDATLRRMAADIRREPGRGSAAIDGMEFRFVRDGDGNVYASPSFDAEHTQLAHGLRALGKEPGEAGDIRFQNGGWQISTARNTSTYVPLDFSYPPIAAETRQSAAAAKLLDDALYINEGDRGRAVQWLRQTRGSDPAAREAMAQLEAPLPMDEASRMARATEQGYEGPFYHGTPNNFDRFEGDAWLTSSPERAEGYSINEAGDVDGSQIMPLMARGRVFQSPGRPATAAELQAPRADGYDGIEFTGARGDRVRLMYAGEDGITSNIRSRFAAFDPAKSGSSDLLASAAPIAAGGATLGALASPQDASASDGSEQGIPPWIIGAGMGALGGAAWGASRLMRGRRARMEPQAPMPRLEEPPPRLPEYGPPSPFHNVYHGTASAFDEYDPSLRGSLHNEQDASNAFMFTDNPRLAGDYADEAAALARELRLREAYQTHPDLAEIERKRLQAWRAAGRATFPWTRATRVRRAESLNEELDALVNIIAPPEGANIRPERIRLGNPLISHSNWDSRAWAETIKSAMEEGRDGVIFEGVRDGVNLGPTRIGNVYAVFDKRNIRPRFSNRPNPSSSERR